MVSDLPVCSFGELFAVPLRNGVTRPTAVRGAGFKMVNMGEIFANRFIGDIPMDRVHLSTDEMGKFLLHPEDLLFARQSLVLAGAGKCSIFVGASEQITFEGHLIRVRLNQDIASPAYYFYYFNSDQGRQAIESIVEQVAAAGIRGSDLARLVVPFPRLSDQRAIAAILGALDDKIELNRRMNATLEEMARAVFRAWFVDFEPVRAKAEGRAPHSADATTAALFPNNFEIVAGREIPSGWHVQRIGDVVRVVGGSTPSTSEPAYWKEGTIHWTTPKDLSLLADPILLTTERRITEIGLRQISSGLLPKGTVLLSSRAPIGYLAIAEVPTAVNQGFIAMVCDQDLPNYYVWLWAEAQMGAIKGRANGTTFLEISKANFRPMEVIVPTTDVLRAFVSYVEPLFQEMVNNLRQCHYLAHLRDTLLPKLLSGEVRVQSAERSVEQSL